MTVFARFVDYSYIFATIGFTVYGQLILKWRITQYGAMPADWVDRPRFLLSLFLDPYILSGFIAAFLAALAWMAAMTRFELSHAYPFMSLSFVMVLLGSAWLLSEPVSLQRYAGVALIVFGTVVAARA